MITYGFAKGYKYAGDGTLMIQVRLPAVHGPFLLSDYQGRIPRNYVKDSELPYFPSLLLPHLPSDGEVVAVTTLNNSTSEFLVLGLTGGSYYSNISGEVI